MKKTIKLFALIFIFYSFLCSCEDTADHERIEIDLDDALDKNTQFKIKSLIKLETTDSSLIGEITDIIMCSDYILIYDRHISQNLFVFNHEGKYISKLKKGKGPGGINPPRSKVKSGVSSDQLPYYNYVIYNKDFTKEISYILPVSKEMQSIYTGHPISFYKGNPLFTSPLSNYIYTYDFDLKKEKIVYELDFGRYNIKPEDYQENFLKAYDLAGQGERAILSSCFCETDDFIAFNMSFKVPVNFCIYSKKNKQHYFSPQVVHDNILPKCDFVGTYNESFIGIVDCAEMLKFNEKVNIVEDTTLSENDNPYILLFDVIQ